MNNFINYPINCKILIIMALNIANEFSQLKKVIVCYGDSLPEYGKYKSNDPQFLKFHHLIWNKSLLLKQQGIFFRILEKYGVKLEFAKTNKNYPWQTYTRDIGFVYQNNFFYSKNRAFKEREGEIESMLDIIKKEAVQGEIIPIEEGALDGGDILVREKEVFIGLSDRTNKEALNFLDRHFSIKPLFLGEMVMHLDTRLTLLPSRKILIYPQAFQKDDLDYLKKQFDFIEVAKKEAESLAINVLVVNPETIVVHAAHKKIQTKLKRAGFNVKVIDYSEPIALAGSFRCTTLPLQRLF